MRIVCEAQDTRICIRLLGDLTGAVVAGTYVIDGTPQILEPLSFDVEEASILDDEVNIYFAGFAILPNRFVITLPNATVQYINIGDKAPQENPVTKAQEVFVATPIDSVPMLHPTESVVPKAQPITPPYIPPFWVDLNFNSTGPLKLGAGITSDAIYYTGGAPGRYLSSIIQSPEQNYAPWLLRAPARLEGEYTNHLQNSEFVYDPLNRGAYLDPTPVGWRVSLSDPLSLLRQQISTAGIPTWTVRFTTEPTHKESSAMPSLTIYSPIITNPGETFQVILLPASDAVASYVQLKTEDGLHASPPISLAGGTPVLASLNIGASAPTSVKIEWYHSAYTEKRAQVLQLIAPTSGLYTGGHSWIPYGIHSAADLITISQVTFGNIWFFTRGIIHTEYSGDSSVGKPPSWSILTHSGDVVLRVNGGVLGSDANGLTLDLTPYLAPNTDLSGYDIQWTSLADDFIFTAYGANKKPKAPVTLPFRLNQVPDTYLTQTLDVGLTGYSPVEGTHIITKWNWKAI